MHIRDTKWAALSAAVGKQIRYIEDLVVKSGTEVVETLDDLLFLHGGSEASLAGQLFETEAPTEAQISMTRDLVQAVEGIRALVSASAGSAVPERAGRPAAMRRIRRPL